MARVKKRLSGKVQLRASILFTFHSNPIIVPNLARSLAHSLSLSRSTNTHRNIVFANEVHKNLPTTFQVIKREESNCLVSYRGIDKVGREENLGTRDCASDSNR